MKKSRSFCLPILLLILAMVCVVGLAGAGLFLVLPVQAERTFGPPAPGLGTVQQTYLAARLLLQKNDLTLPQNAFSPPQSFQIELGESTTSIATRLEREGLIADDEIFITYLQYSGLDTGLQAGEYELSPRQAPVEIAHKLQDATPTEVTFRILDGWRMEEIANALPTSGLNIPENTFLAAVQARPEGIDFLDQLPEDAALEGFLYPDSYRLPRTISAEELVLTLLKNFDLKVDADLRQGYERQGLTLFEAVTLASMVEREAVVAEEMPLIASVFYNRLALGIKLDSDPTVQYALGFNPQQDTWWTNPLSLDDLKVDSPYNTYQTVGLPPGPIANPSMNALKAVAYPAQSPYYYFRATCDGSGRHVFAETFDEHLGNDCP